MAIAADVLSRRIPNNMRIKSIIIIAALAVTAVSCRKETESSGSAGRIGSGQPANLTALFAQRTSDARQQFTVDASLGGVVTGGQGTTLTFLPNAFRSATGAIPTGQVSIELIEVLDLRTMLRLNKPTVSVRNGMATLLRSGGQVRVRAMQGGSSLRIGSNTMSVRIPADAIDPLMEVFYGTDQVDGTVGWVEAVEEGLLGDSTSSGQSPFFYEFDADSLGWLNCDYFPISAITSIRVALPNNFTNANTIAWVAVPSLNGLTSTWAEDMMLVSGLIPIGASAMVIALHENADGHYESSFTPITIAPNMNVGIVFQPTTLAQFDAAISGL